METIIIIAVVVIIIWAYGRKKRSDFAREFNIVFPTGKFKLKKLGHPASVNEFTLVYPHWEYAKADGTKDARRSSNSLIGGDSTLSVGAWEVRCPNPVHLYSLITELRSKGTDISLIPQEHTKMNQGSVMSQARHATSLAELIQTFYGKPDLFSHFCADLCRQQGYEVTEYNEPGFDFTAELGGVEGLVACSCLNVHSNVGLPAVRKLVDANVLAGTQELMYMTTGGYSSQAVALAHQEGVHLIDGTQLIGMVQQAWGGSASSEGIPYTEYTLTMEELMQGYPADARIVP